MISLEFLNPESGMDAAAGAQMAASTGPYYIEAASVMDVMYEQLEYLVSHRSPDCPQGCAECARLAQVERCLLLPFGTARATATLH